MDEVEWIVLCERFCRRDTGFVEHIWCCVWRIFFHTHFAVSQCVRGFPNTPTWWDSWHIMSSFSILQTTFKACFVHDRVRRGVGLFLIWRHAWTLCEHACKVDCDVKSGLDPLSLLGREQQKVLGFSQVLKAIKWQDLLEEGKNDRNAFITGAKIHFSEKILRG